MKIAIFRVEAAIPGSTAPIRASLFLAWCSTRQEDGFYARLASGLAETGLPSLRFDFRAHGESVSGVKIWPGPVTCGDVWP